MQRRRDRAKDWWLRHLGLDCVVASAIAITAWLAWPTADLGVAERFALLATVATFDGLVLAASTFSAQMMSQASNPLAVKVRRLHRPLINRTSRATLSGSLMCAAGALTALFGASTWPHVVDTVAAFCVALPVLRGLRAVDWFVIVSLSEEVDDRPATPARVLKPQIHAKRYVNER